MHRRGHKELAMDDDTLRPRASIGYQASVPGTVRARVGGSTSKLVRRRSSGGRTLRNMNNRTRSYRLLIAPPMTSGQPKLESPSKYPAMIGLTAPAMLRGAEVMPAAAGRSGGVTTAITYDVRAGTSIWQSALRTSRSPIAISSRGAKGTRI